MSSMDDSEWVDTNPIYESSYSVTGQGISRERPLLHPQHRHTVDHGYSMLTAAHTGKECIQNPNLSPNGWYFMGLLQQQRLKSNFI